jgi:hypothetical protein
LYLDLSGDLDDQFGCHDFFIDLFHRADQVCFVVPGQKDLAKFALSQFFHECKIFDGDFMEYFLMIFGRGRRDRR